MMPENVNNRPARQPHKCLRPVRETHAVSLKVTTSIEAVLCSNTVPGVRRCDTAPRLPRWIPVNSSCSSPMKVRLAARMFTRYIMSGVYGLSTCFLYCARSL